MLSIERITEKFAFCIDDDGKKVKISRTKLPQDASKNDILVISEDGSYAVDKSETAIRKSRGGEMLSRMDARSRRDSINKLLTEAKTPVSAASLAEKYHVSRQIIVGDIALLRASGAGVIATPRGYLIQHGQIAASDDDYTIVCSHSSDELLLDELYTVVDSGATVVDVIVEHPVYGQLTGLLQVSSRYDADRFVETLRSSNAAPLSQITDGIHLHTIRCPDPDRIEYIKAQLLKKGILIEG
ncbi:MAG: DUF3006 family protein [Oscillospiraceae bacterium]|nr:DUF3006 family protein [Oscillospiraceae bacterium]MBQ4539105.1 DUF3006 family protein [Oscillospiraceae bacterium]